MKTSKHGRTLIEQREGIRLKVYRDSKGLPTVGVGHLITPQDKLKVGDRITEEQCEAFLIDDLGIAEDAVNSLVKVKLSQNQFDALVSFIVNIGVTGFRKSTVLRRLNTKDYDGAAKAMMMWVKPPEITGRRRTEVKQFLTKDLGVSQDAATDVTPPTKIAPLVSSGESQPPITDGQQIAENITNVATGDKNLPDNFKSEDKVIQAPAPSGILDKGWKWLAGLGLIPASFGGLVETIKNLAADGNFNFADAIRASKDIFIYLLPYLFWVAIAFVVFWGLKELLKQLSFIVNQYTIARGDMHNVTVVPAGQWKDVELPTLPQPQSAIEDNV